MRATPGADAEGPAIGFRPWPVAGRSAAAIRHLNARRDPVSLTSAQSFHRFLLSWLVAPVF